MHKDDLLDLLSLVCYVMLLIIILRLILLAMKMRLARRAIFNFRSARKSGRRAVTGVAKEGGRDSRNCSVLQFPTERRNCLENQSTSLNSTLSRTPARSNRTAARAFAPTTDN
jgi:hypothetical protein